MDKAEERAKIMKHEHSEALNKRDEEHNNAIGALKRDYEQ